MREPKIRDYDYILSSIGNAYFSGLSFTELWDSVRLSSNREELDICIQTQIKLKEMLK